MCRILLLTWWCLTTVGLAAQAPHILFVMLDDVGFADVSYHGGNIPTPFIDELANTGLRLERYYVHPLCTPTRLSFLTGRYSHNLGWGSGGVRLGAAPFCKVKQMSVGCFGSPNHPKPS